MQRYFVYLSYNGANYHGWQVQPNGVSVQEVLEKSFSTILSESVNITGAGRTDAGVHAGCMVAHFDVSRSVHLLDNTKKTSMLIGKLNNFIPSDIAIQKIVPVTADAHARFDATSRKYEYHLTTSKNPFLTALAYRYTNPLDFDLMNQAAKVLFDYVDFTSFSKLHTDVKTNNCEIMQAEWVKHDNDLYIFTIKADRFLRNMVRAIVGTLLEVGRGRLTIEGFRTIIEKKDRSLAGTSMPAHALYLVDVEYPKEIFLSTLMLKQ